MKKAPAKPATYKDSGVDADRAEDALHRATSLFRETWPEKDQPGGVQLDFRYFANVIEIGGLGIALCTDGVGSKAMVAQMMERYDTIGIDCVAMNVNDLICVGARPVSFVDTLALQALDPEMYESVAQGLHDGAVQAGVSISGGETAQLPDMIHGGARGVGFDLVGTAIGHVKLDEIIIGEHLRDGDAVIGIESNGIHSNGFTLARQVFFERGGLTAETELPELDGASLGEELLRPTFIYVKEVLDLFDRGIEIKALAHITGDGLMNLNRVAADVGFVIDALPDIPPIFDSIMKHGDVSPAEMFHVFNMGIGFCLMVEPSDAPRVLEILSAHGRAAHIIGRVTADHPRQVRLSQHGLIGKGKSFHPV